MFKDNLKNLRKAKGLSQEELADRLHMVRQTISKWEKGLSVPDADMLIRLSEIFETSVSNLLSSDLDIEAKEDLIVEKLEQLNFLLATRNKRSRLIVKWVLGGFLSLIIFALISICLSVGISVIDSNEDSPWQVEITSSTTHEKVIP